MLRTTALRKSNPRQGTFIRNFCSTVSSGVRVSLVPELSSWNVDAFRRQAFEPEHPAKLPRQNQGLPKAFTEWFRQDGQSARTCELNTKFWSQFENAIVPLELTTITNSQKMEATFHRSEAPLKILLDHLNDPDVSSGSGLNVEHSIYLAQCELTTLPGGIQDQLPPPTIVTLAGKGDIYSSSLWLGRPPTYTPLHRDPNPNLFLQLAGYKVIRLFPPEIGNTIFDHVQERLAAAASTSNAGQRASPAPVSASFRGEEMMQGPERQLLHDIVWGANASIHKHSPQPPPNFNSKKTTPAPQEEARIFSSSSLTKILEAYAQEAILEPGEALFIPKGWWHSVKGITEDQKVQDQKVRTGSSANGTAPEQRQSNRRGITASVNWWFR